MPLLPLASHSITDFCPIRNLNTIISDFMDFLYPVVPIIHRPTFQQSLHDKLHLSSPSFIRVCLSIAAITVASMPRKFPAYASGCSYTSVNSMVARAAQIVSVSRLQTAPDYAENPDLELVTSSLLLSIASHYAGLANLGWMFANEAVLFTRTLKLSSREGYSNISAPEEQMRKRAFWLGYIIQL